MLAHQQGRRDEAIALDRAQPGAVAGRRGLAQQPGHRLPVGRQGWTRRSTPTSVRSPSIPATRTRTAISACCCGRPESPPRRKPRIAPPFDCNPDHVDAYTNLGILLNGLQRTEEAAACFCKVITLRPKHREARRLLALAHCTLGEIDEAVKIFDEWLEEEPEDPIALHMLAACTGRDVPPRASDGFVETTFDSFAASFESKLERLSYRAPALVAAMLEDSGLEPSKRLDVLDAGCGTGLCGPLVAPYARRLVGVDLSDGMLAHAREKNVYDALTQGRADRLPARATATPSM